MLDDLRLQLHENRNPVSAHPRRAPIPLWGLGITYELPLRDIALSAPTAHWIVRRSFSSLPHSANLW